MRATEQRATMQTTAADVVGFWTEAGPKAWFRKDAAFDRSFRMRFLAAHEQAAAGALDHWLETAEGALALIILLDQFPRNAFRDSARSFATDAQARALAERAIAAGFDLAVAPELRFFFYMPFEHSERAADQQRAVELMRPIGGETLRFAEVHADVIRRFGRFPHRNRILGRESTAAEVEFLAQGGFAG